MPPAPKPIFSNTDEQTMLKRWNSNAQKEVFLHDADLDQPDIFSYPDDAELHSTETSWIKFDSGPALSNDSLPWRGPPNVEQEEEEEETDYSNVGSPFKEMQKNESSESVSPGASPPGFSKAGRAKAKENEKMDASLGHSNLVLESSLTTILNTHHPGAGGNGEVRSPVYSSMYSSVSPGSVSVSKSRHSQTTARSRMLGSLASRKNGPPELGASDKRLRKSVSSTKNRTSSSGVSAAGPGSQDTIFNITISPQTFFLCLGVSFSVGYILGFQAFKYYWTDKVRYRTLVY